MITAFGNLPFLEHRIETAICDVPWVSWGWLTSGLAYKSTKVEGLLNEALNPLVGLERRNTSRR